MNITLENTTATAASAADASKRSKLADAAQQFEAMMLQELLKPMRRGEDDLSGNKSEDNSFETMASFGTESVAKAISQSGGLGLARQVIQQLSAAGAKDAALKEAQPGTKV
jgi:Rod binding domain-containing protein